MSRGIMPPMDYEDDHDDAVTQADDDRLRDVHKRAMRRFDATIDATRENRAQSLAARRFVTIPGAQWESEWGDQFANSIKVEHNKVSRGVEKIERDYRDNRIVPDYRPDGKDANPETADTLDGLHRADSYRFKSQQARDNGVFEALAGGFGAYEVANEWDDETDPKNDHQRVNPARIITDADQSVFFDLASRLYDKSDAKFCFVRVPLTRESFEDEYEGCASDFPEGVMVASRDWFTPDTIAIAKYYEVEEVKETLWVLTATLSGEQNRLWSSDLEPGQLAEYEKDGYTKAKQTRKRRRVRKYILSGAEVLDDCGYIAGDQIPIVPIYGKRYFVEGIERWKGYVQDKMDPARLYNSMVSKLAELQSLSPREVPIFASEQMDSVLAEEWASANQRRLPFLRTHVLRNEDGTIAQAGPLGYIKPPDLPPSLAALMQLANNDLIEDQQDSSETVRSNVSAEAMDMAATRIDAKSGIYLDNIRLSVLREGELYLCMAKEVYAEDGREVETMTEDGDHGTAKLKAQFTDKQGNNRVINDLQNARYKVIVSVSEATSTRQDKTVKSALMVAETAIKAGDTEMARAALLTAVANMDGEGMDDLKAYVRKVGLGIGVFQPNEEEAQAMQAEAENAKPDPMAAMAEAQAQDLTASAQKKAAEIPLIEARVKETEAKTVATLVEARQPKPLPKISEAA